MEEIEIILITSSDEDAQKSKNSEHQSQLTQAALTYHSSLSNYSAQFHLYNPKKNR
jgi:hypothetical protein